MPIYFGQRTVLRILGISLEVEGKLCKEKPVLYLANHASYVDIIVVCALLPAVCVSKEEVKKWPMFGRFARLANTIFISREVRDTKQNLEKISAVIRRGESVLMFPEGTTTDGSQVLPFKSSYLKVVENDLVNREVTIQPITIAYTKFNGKPMNQQQRNLIAWFGDATLVGHIWELLKLRHTTIGVTFHPVISGAGGKERKQLAKDCHAVVSDSLTQTVNAVKFVS